VAVKAEAAVAAEVAKIAGEPGEGEAAAGEAMAAGREVAKKAAVCCCRG